MTIDFQYGMPKYENHKKSRSTQTIGVIHMFNKYLNTFRAKILTVPYNIRVFKFLEMNKHYHVRNCVYFPFSSQNGYYLVTSCCIFAFSA